MTLIRRRVEGGYGTNYEPVTRFHYDAPFEVDGITYTPPGIQPPTGGEGLMFGTRIDQPGACGGWRWRPRACPTSKALAMGWPSPVDGTVKAGVPSRHTP
jgi:hypothetical protein